MANIAIYGGTFNPIHNGHIIACNTLYDTGIFEKILLIPSGNPPLKSKDVMAKSVRLKMCQKVVEHMGFVEVSDYEMQQEEKSYTLHTLQYFQQQYPKDTLYFVIGYDNMDTIENWYEAKTLLNEYNLVILKRSGYDECRYTKKLDILQKKYKGEFKMVDMPPIGISSSDVRSRMKEKKSIHGYVPVYVEEVLNVSK